MLVRPPHAAPCGHAVALYARVSTERQAEAQTVGSQLAALRERAAGDGLPIASALEFVDEGYSGATLVRPALEQLRDLAALGGVEVLYVHSPDRLARKYVQQVLLLEEFARGGVRVVFLNQAQQQTPEDELLLQVQGVIAEYERAKIIERVRRGRRHAARLGSLSALAQAPYGFRYLGPAQGVDPPRYEVVLDEARVVRQLFEWVGRDRLSLGAVARRLTQAGIPTRTGKPRWDRGTVGAMLHNPAYKGEAAYGRTRSGPWQRQTLRPVRGKSAHPRHPATEHRVPPADWIALAVPPIVEGALFAAVQEQLAENQRRARAHVRGARHLLQGLLVCGNCGYAIPGSTVSYPTKDGHLQRRTYYRCRGRDAPRFGGEPLCYTAPLAAAPVEAAIWAEVRAVLEDPTRLEAEYARRAAALQDSGAQPASRATAAQLAKLRQGLGRLIDSYTEGLIGKEEFEPRLGRLRQRIAALELHAQQEAEEAATTHELQLLVGRLDEFATKVHTGLADADWHLRREIIRALVKEIEVTTDQITVVFRIGPQPRGPGPPPDHLPHCLSRLAAQAAEGRRAAFTTEGAGDLLLDFDHAQVALCLVVGERDAEVGQEGQHTLRLSQQGIEQILGGSLFGPAAATVPRRPQGRRWLGGIALGQQRVVLGNPVRLLMGWHLRGAARAPLLDGRVHGQQQVAQVSSPALVVLLRQEGQLAHQMRRAPTVPARPVGVVAGPAVMRGPPLEARPDANRLGGRVPALGMPGQMGEPARAVDVQPVQLALDAHAGLIGVLVRPCRDEIGDVGHGGRQGDGRLSHPRDDAAIADGAGEQVGQRLARALLGHQLVLVEIDRHGPRVRAVLDGRADLRGTNAAAECPTGRATHLLHLVLGHLQAPRRHVVHLAPLHHRAGHRLQARLTLHTHHRMVPHDHIRSLDRCQGVASMARLPTWLFATRRASTAPLSSQTVAGGRLAAVVAVLGQACPQFNDAPLLARNPCLQAHDRF
jgi:site-specific DNA recombinase